MKLSKNMTLDESLQRISFEGIHPRSYSLKLIKLSGFHSKHIALMNDDKIVQQFKIFRSLWNSKIIF